MMGESVRFEDETTRFETYRRQEKLNIHSENCACRLCVLYNYITMHSVKKKNLHYACMYVCVYVCMCVCVYVCMYVRTYVCYSESKYRLRISLAHPRDCHFEHMQ